jgi:hypothetical protein
MDRRFQVFVSSTFQDLREERQQVMQALLELDCMPSGMELFPASDESQWDLITRVIDDCDYYLVIVGGRYGSVDAKGISYTEREYDYAVKKGIPSLAFVHADPKEIPVGKSEMEPLAREKLQKFLSKVQQRMCKYWKTPEELGGVVSRSLVVLMKLRPGEGWVRGRFASNAEEMQKLRSKVDELTARLEVARVAPPEHAKSLAQGSDLFELRVTVDARRTKKPLTWTLTWNEIVKCVGPRMYDEASEHDLYVALKAKLATKMGTDDLFSISIRTEDFETILVQLLALGLIQKSVKKRPPKDSDPYWRLTPYGEHCVTTLKAIPRPNRDNG